MKVMAVGKGKMCVFQYEEKGQGEVLKKSKAGGAEAEGMAVDFDRTVYARNNNPNTIGLLLLDNGQTNLSIHDNNDRRDLSNRLVRS